MYISRSYPMACNRTPEGANGPPTPTGIQFRIEIETDPKTYIPLREYTVYLQSTESVVHSSKRQFVGFTLSVDPAPVEITNGEPERESRSAGIFSLINIFSTKISEKCPNLVIQTSQSLKSKIQVRWRAPPAGNGCVLFRGAVLESTAWYMDDGGLQLELCENTDFEQFSVLRHCCACEEAKYEMRFEGLWTRQSHPKGFPANMWLTRFSDVIGASHAPEYWFWKAGGNASVGLIEFAETESTGTVEAEIKGNKTRTVIKAKGIGYPNLTGRTFAVFRVDAQHHLLSLLSMIIPSPDWFVGIYRLELCQQNCSWIKYKELELYPYDLGIYDDITYISRKNPTTGPERGVITRINSSYPNDTHAPFYDPSGEDIKPLAKLILTRQRLYDKVCSGEPANLEDDCGITPWVYSKCSGNCGPGKITLRRNYIKESVGDMCHKEMEKEIDCFDRNNCGISSTSKSSVDPACETGEWSDWSECSEPCGDSVTARFKILRDKDFSKICANISESSLEEVKKCNQKDDCEPVPENIESCALTNWTKFSPCTENCIRQRSRSFLTHPRETPPSCITLVTTQRIKCECPINKY